MPLGNIFASDHGVPRVPVTMRTHQREEQERTRIWYGTPNFIFSEESLKED